MWKKFRSFCSSRCYCLSPQSSSPQSSPRQDPPPTDFKKFLEKFDDISKIDTLIAFLEKLLQIARGSREEIDDGGSTSSSHSFIDDGQKMMKMLDKRIGKSPVQQSSWDGKVKEIEKVCVEVLKGSEKIPTVGIALCMLGSVLEKVNDMSENRKECFEVLGRMVDLGKLIMKLNERMPEQKNKLDEGVNYIIEGSIMCISQLASFDSFRFIAATVNKESLKGFQLKVDRYIESVTFAYIVEGPQYGLDPPERYPNPLAVGIGDAKKKVIELLDLNTQDPIPIVVVVHGLGGIGKTTIADAVYGELNLQSYKHCSIKMDQDCTENHIIDLQEQILNGLFNKNITLRNRDHGYRELKSVFQRDPNQRLFLYIDNGLISTDLEKLLPKHLIICLPPKSRMLVTTRNLVETDIFVGKDIERRAHDVNPLPDVESRKLLLEEVPQYNDENNIVNLLKMCGGVPDLLKFAGSELASDRGNRENIKFKMLNEGAYLERITKGMVDFVYHKLPEPYQEAFLDITSFFYDCRSKYVANIVGKDEFRGLEAASFVKTSEEGQVIIHEIVKARGKKLSDQEGNRIKKVNTLSRCLRDEEKLEKLRGIYLVEGRERNQPPPIEINCDHQNSMSQSLRVLCYKRSFITFSEECENPFEQLRCLIIHDDASDLPMGLEKLEYEFPSLTALGLHHFKNMERLPDGVEKLENLKSLALFSCHKLRELPAKLTELRNLEELTLQECNELKGLPSNFGQLTNLEELNLICCPGLVELPSNFGGLQNLKRLDLKDSLNLKKWPSSIEDLTKVVMINLTGCSQILRDSLPENIINKCKIV